MFYIWFLNNYIYFFFALLATVNERRNLFSWAPTMVYFDSKPQQEEFLPPWLEYNYFNGQPNGIKQIDTLGILFPGEINYVYALLPIFRPAASKLVIGHNHSLFHQEIIYLVVYLYNEYPRCIQCRGLQPKDTNNSSGIVYMQHFHINPFSWQEAKSL